MMFKESIQKRKESMEELKIASEGYNEFDL
jgi:hypothetical protein